MSKLPDIRSGAQIMMTCTQQERLDLTKTCPFLVLIGVLYVNFVVYNPA